MPSMVEDKEAQPLPQPPRHQPTSDTAATTTKPAHAPAAVQTLEWERPEGRKPGRGVSSRLTRFAPLAAVSEKFDTVFPPYKRYFGQSRRTAFFIAVGIFLVVFALAIGLGVGLSSRSK